jgi:hypothetical protein
MSENIVPKKRQQVPIDVGSDIHKGVSDIILEDFKLGLIKDIDMSPSKYIRDIVSQYIRYRSTCKDIGAKPLPMSELIDSFIEVDKLAFIEVHKLIS